MPIRVNGTNIAHVVFKAPGINQEVDYVNANGTRVFESTIYIAKPTVTANLTYNGRSQSPTISPSSSAGWYIASGSVTSATNGGTYYIVFKLRQGYAWNDRTTTDLTIGWTIKRQSVAIPTITTPSVAYIGSTVSPTVSGYNANLMIASGNTSYNGISNSLLIYWTLRNTTNYQWSDGSTTRKSGSWSTYAGTITWYLQRAGSSTAYTFQTTYGRTFYELAGTWSNTVGGTHALIIQNENYATYEMYSGSERQYTDAFRDSGGTQYSRNATPTNGTRYY